MVLHAGRSSDPTGPARPFPSRAGPPPPLSPSLPLPFPAPPEPPPPPPPRHSAALPPPGAEPSEPRPRPASVTRMRGAAAAEGAVGWEWGGGECGSVGLWPPPKAAQQLQGAALPLQAAGQRLGVSLGGISLCIKQLGWCALSSKHSEKRGASCRHFLPLFPLNVS